MTGGGRLVMLKNCLSAIKAIELPCKILLSPFLVLRDSKIEVVS